jgi:hypothetical protein
MTTLHRALLPLAGLILIGPGPGWAKGPVTENYPGAPFTISIGSSNSTTSGQYKATYTFKLDNDSSPLNGKTFQVKLNPPHPANASDPKKGTTVNFYSVLTKAYPKWNFAIAPAGTNGFALADDSLVVKTYDAATLATGGTPVKVGFYVAYTGKTPPPGANLHWIQVIEDNYAGTGLYTVENVVDFATDKSPYYDIKGNATGSQGSPDAAFLSDKPFIDSNNIGKYFKPGQPVYFNAESYLVQETAGDNGMGGSNVTLLDGVRWGWTLTLLPEPAAWSLMLLGVGAVGAALRASRARRATLQI